MGIEFFIFSTGNGEHELRSHKFMTIFCLKFIVLCTFFHTDFECFLFGFSYKL